LRQLSEQHWVACHKANAECGMRNAE
jgi:hypothetical protein